MGFWHTGYIEFHQPDWEFDSTTISILVTCSECEASFTDLDSLRSHRFESHRLKVPKLFLGEREIGSHPVKVTKPIKLDDVYVENVDLVFLNEREIRAAELSRELASISRDTCKIRLEKRSVVSEFTLVINVASKKDLSGVERAFQNLVNGRNLNARAIEKFISDSCGFESAIGYCDGISLYLYGVLAKEGCSEIQTPFENYPGKFNAAADKLIGFDRPLAKSIASLIAFHFNQFAASTSIANDGRVRFAADTFARLLKGTGRPAKKERVETRSMTDALITDLDLERIIRWSITPVTELVRSIAEIEALMRSSITARPINEFDRAKLQILLCETYSANGNSKKALEHARALRNISSFEHWAESVIIKNSTRQK
jgi:hypothetical protein